MTYYEFLLGPDVEERFSGLRAIAGRCLGVNLQSCVLPYGALVQPILVLNAESQRRVDWDNLDLDAKIRNSPSGQLFVIIINDTSHTNLVSRDAKQNPRLRQFIDKAKIVVISISAPDPSKVSTKQSNHVQQRLA